jgi:hypothetical protein
VTEDGVNHVMRLFFRHLALGGEAPALEAASPSGDYLERMSEVVAAICEEERLDNAS